MNEPDEFRELEGELIRRYQRQPDASMRDRVLGAVRRELRTSRDAAARRGAWRFATAVAAAVLLWANLSLSATLDTHWRLTAEPDARRVDATAGAVRRLLPDWPERDTMRHALLARGASGLTALPDPQAIPKARVDGANGK